MSRESSPHSLSSDPVVEESLSPISCRTLSLDPKNQNTILPTVEHSKDIVEVMQMRKDENPMSRVDNKTDDPS